ncbi:histidine kinase [Bacteroidia bacterium]|nr:histidine kinase [Bacteroidia bacterium]
MENQMNFRISSALKNLIGKELITDEFVAVFELVKNSFDANAKHVKVIFENQYNPLKAKIIIIDDGKGMDEKDLKNKWLFVGYSAKKEGTENDDYRDKIKNKRIFAGAKGIGRFSCDKLGASLTLVSNTHTNNSKVEVLKINWEKFEQDAKEEFINIPVTHRALTKTSCSLDTGTILSISKLRDEWNRERILKLKRSLEKLINPIQENDIQNFDIEIVAKDEILQDKKEITERDKVNGNIKNFIFETLGLKTTQIEVDIVENGGVIQTTLTDRGQLIYRIKEKNPYQISDINIQLFQLSRNAKATFTKLMGVEPIKYGSVFMYKNGFRIYPYGEPGEDILGIDKRKQQGYNRFLGTRDLTGRISIYNNPDKFRETTSRDGGLIKDEDYKQLVELFTEKALRRLEKYAVDIIKWGDERTDKETGEINPELNPEDVKSEILDIIASLTKTKDILNAEYDEKFLDIIDSRQEKSVTQIAKNFSRIAEETNNPELVKQAKQAEQHVKTLISVKKEIEKELDVEKEKKENVEKQLVQRTKQNLFLQSIQTLDKDKIINYHHDIGVQSSTIQNWLNRLSKSLNKGGVDINEVKKVVEAITRANNKILSISRFATKANFNSAGEKINADIIAFIEQYAEGVFKEFFTDIKVHFKDNSKSGFIILFKPIEISVLLDNLISNSIKAGAKNFFIHINETTDKEVEFSFANDGVGLSKDIQNPDDIFEKGVTTTNGSGLGLYHVATIVKELNGNINVNRDYKNGFEILIRLKK